MEVEGYPNCAALKSHKILPRRRILSNDVKKPLKNGLRLDTLHRYDSGDDGLSKQIHSWIPEPPQMHNGVARSLPLTPPLLTRDDEKTNKSTHSANSSDKRGITNGADRTPDLSTPVNHRSPPTPDTTPPRQLDKTTVLLTPFSSLQVASSRAESFQTAREQLSSDDEDQQSSAPSSHILPRKWLRKSCATDQEDVGLGLDFESTDEGSTSIPAPRKKQHHYDAFLAFDGSWGNSREDANDTSSSATELGAQHSKNLAGGLMRDQESTLGTVSETTTKEYTSNHAERVSPRVTHKSRNSSLNDSMERSVGSRSQPSQEEDDLDAKIRQIDNRRLSQMSAASTVVEAIVVDKTPRRQHTLRHTSKNLSLRNVSLTSNDSNRSSVISTLDEPVHRLIHHKKKLSQTGHRYSTMSDNVLTSGTTFAKDHFQSLPVEAVPQRRSSLKASNKESPEITPSGQKKIRRSSRPATAPEGTFEDQEYLRGRLRARAPIMFPNMSRPNGSKTRQLPPAIPTRSSSLSAPTSRNVSRTTSLTSTSLHAHNMQLESQLNQAQPAADAPIEIPAEAAVTESRPSHSAERSGEYWSSLHPPSMRLTPFSLASIQSSTPGTLEVNEATAISIYPHNNKSILVVQQMARQGSEDTPERFATIVESTNINTTEPLTPPPTARPKQQVDSPLRNPREAPEPPAFTIIPPTPMPPNGGPTEGVSRSPSVTAGSGRFGMVKRALSARRYSESFISPLARSLSKRNTSATRRQVVNDENSNNKLSPFWRPRGFWDDLSDSESDFGNDGLLVHNTNDNSLKRTISGGAASIGRRFGSLKHKYTTPRFERNGVRIERNWTQESIMGNNNAYDHEGRNRNTGIMAKLGHHVQFPKPINAIQDRFEQWQIKRNEDKREKERARLRRSIGTIIVHPDARIA